MTLDEDKLQDYIDGRLDDLEHAEFAAYLLENPDAARYADELRRQNETLKLLGADILSEEVPERLRQTLRSARASGLTPGPVRKPPSRLPSPWMQVAAALVIFAIGGTIGWFGHDRYLRGPTPDQLALSSGLDAYRLYGAESNHAVEFGDDRLPDLEDWITRVFSTKITPPQLDELGYRYIGGRLLPWSNGNIGFFLFENKANSRVAMVWWPRGSLPPSPLTRMQQQGDVKAQFWGADKFGFAIYADQRNEDFDSLGETVYGFYEALFGKK